MICSRCAPGSGKLAGHRGRHLGMGAFQPPPIAPSIQLESLPLPVTNLSGWLTTVPFDSPRAEVPVVRLPAPVPECRPCSISIWGACSRHGGLSDPEKHRLRKTGFRPPGSKP